VKQTSLKAVSACGTAFRTHKKVAADLVCHFADLPSLLVHMLLAQVSPGQTSVLSGFLGCRSAEMMPDELRNKGANYRSRV
jgi:hypothetical protein